jgi:hypothetical protein
MMTAYLSHSIPFIFFRLFFTCTVSSCAKAAMSQIRVLYCAEAVTSRWVTFSEYISVTFNCIILVNCTNAELADMHFTLTAVVMHRSIFLDTVPCSLFIVNWHFGGKRWLHFLGWRISQERNQHEACSSFACCPLISNILYPQKSRKYWVLVKHTSVYYLDYEFKKLDYLLSHFTHLTLGTLVLIPRLSPNPA